MTRPSHRWILLGGLLGLLSVLAFLTVSSGPVLADDGPRGSFRARMTGLQEPPSVLSPGRGAFAARLINDGTALQYRLTYEGLGAPIFMAHIHVAQPAVNGGIAVWLCDNPGDPSDPTGLAPVCDGTTSGEVTGIIDADNVIAIGGPPNQALAAGEFEKLLRAIRDGVTYANIHTTSHPSGEIRGQIRRGGDDDGDDDDDDVSRRLARGTVASRPTSRCAASRSG